MPDLPDDAVEEAERLTRLARRATAEEAAAYEERRADLLAAHGFRARVREADDTLVLHPEEWLEDGEVRVDRVRDTDRAVERSLSGPGEGAAWDEVEAHNAALVAAVRSEHGADHAANARVFADFMGNHYKKRVEDATAAEVEEFLDEYYRRNAWPSGAQQKRVVGSLRRLLSVAAGLSGARRPGR
jgi:hypothetical protein